MALISETNIPVLHSQFCAHLEFVEWITCKYWFAEKFRFMFSGLILLNTNICHRINIIIKGIGGYASVRQHNIISFNLTRTSLITNCRNKLPCWNSRFLFKNTYKSRLINKIPSAHWVIILASYIFMLSRFLPVVRPNGIFDSWLGFAVLFCDEIFSKHTNIAGSLMKGITWLIPDFSGSAWHTQWLNCSSWHVLHAMVSVRLVDFMTQRFISHVNLVTGYPETAHASR